LIRFDLDKSFNALRGRPFHFDYIRRVDLSKAEVKAEITLGHHAGAAVDFIHLNVFAGDYSNAGTNGGPIAFGSYQL
jgi:hypothetical protein